MLAALPVAWNVAAPIGQMILGGAQSIFGLNQRRQARKDLEQLNKETPEMYISESTRRLANEPLSEQLLNQLVESRARRTSQTLGAVAASDPSSVAFMAGRVGDTERAQERTDMANLDQKRIDALAKLGAEEQSLQTRKMDLWQKRVAGAQAEMGAGQENIFAGAGEFLRGASFGLDKLIEKGNPFKSIPGLPDTDKANDQMMEDLFRRDRERDTQYGEVQDVGMDEEEGEEMTFEKTSPSASASTENPFELRGGGLRVPLPNGGTIDIPSDMARTEEEIMGRIMSDLLKKGGDPWATGEVQDVGMDEEEGDEAEMAAIDALSREQLLRMIKRMRGSKRGF